MTIYEGRREDRNVVVTVDRFPLPARNDLKNHSLDGFEWGYAGSGPSQLALALLAHHFSLTDTRELADLKALTLYQTFKEKFIAPLPEEGWQLSSYVVADTVQLIVKDEALAMFTLAVEQKVENDALLHELNECYALQGQSSE